MKREIDPIRKQLNSLLAELRAKQSAIAFMEQRKEQEAARIASEWDPEIKRAKEEEAAIAAELLGLAKYHKATLFAGTERVDVRNGAVLRTIQERVVKIKNMLAKLKASGMDLLIRKVESPDWDGIEKLSKEELEKLGTRRKKKEIFAYEVKGARP